MNNLNLSTQNQENIDSNLGYNPFEPSQLQWSAYGHPYMQPFEQMKMDTPTQHNIFAAYQSAKDPMMDQMLQQLKTMQTKISGLTLKNKKPNASKHKGSILQSDQILNNTCNPKTGLLWKRYCWLCGCCPHWGKTCSTKKKGHKDDATFKNRMNRSNNNCL